MLAKRIGFPVDTKLDSNASYLIEMKFDGERILCHKTRTGVKVYTRNGTDYTELYAPILSKYILNNVKVFIIIIYYIFISVLNVY